MLNLEKLFAAQKVLDDRIVKEHNITHDRFDNLIMALLDEVGECAKETRCFKDWSVKGPNDKVKVICEICDGSGDFNWPHSRECLLEGRAAEPYEKCVECDGTGELGYKNPILEEYVDGLHFILSIGLYMEYNRYIDELKEHYQNHAVIFKYSTLTRQFIMIYATTIDFIKDKKTYHDLFTMYLCLGDMLGFEHTEIEQAYFLKNKVNHQRQDNGY